LAIKLLMGKRERVRRYLLRLMAEIIA